MIQLVFISLQAVRGHWAGHPVGREATSPMKARSMWPANSIISARIEKA